MKLRITIAGGLAAAAIFGLAFASSQAQAGPSLRTYRVTLENLTDGQPFSPGVAATHRPFFHGFSVGDLAHPALEAIAEDGNEAPAVNALDDLMEDGVVTEVFDLNHPLTPNGVVIGDFTDSVTFMIHARPGDRLTLATMLICTNDGFTGLDAAKLPQHGSVVYWTAGYDAGTEDNTEASEDIVDPCSGLGPVHLDGDPNGNEDAAIDSSPHMPIHHHPGIEDGSDLDPAEHDWTNPVAKITIERVD